MNYYKPRISYLGQFGILLGLTGACAVFGSLIALFILKLQTGIQIMHLEKEMFNPAYANALKVFQFVSTFFVFFVPAFLFGLIINHAPLKYLGFKTKFSYAQFFIVAAIAIAGLFLSGALGEVNHLIPISAKAAAYFKKLEDEYAQQVLAIAAMKNVSEYLVGILIMALLPAIFEEVFFRGALQQLFIKWFKNVWVGITFTSIIFSAIHFSYYGFLPRMFLGFALGLIFYYGKNIWLNIFAHFFNNAIAVTQMYMLSKSGKLSKEAMDENFPVILGLPALIVIIIAFFYFYKECSKLNVLNIDNTQSPSSNPFEQDIHQQIDHSSIS